MLANKCEHMVHELWLVDELEGAYIHIYVLRVMVKEWVTIITEGSRHHFTQKRCQVNFIYLIHVIVIVFAVDKNKMV